MKTFGTEKNTKKYKDKTHVGYILNEPVMQSITPQRKIPKQFYQNSENIKYRGLK